MKLRETIQGLFAKILNIGKPKQDDVLYDKVIKKQVPEHSAEKLTFMDIKKTIGKSYEYTKSKIIAVKKVEDQINTSENDSPSESKSSKNKNIKTKKSSTKTNVASNKKSTSKKKDSSSGKTTNTKELKPKKVLTSKSKTVSAKKKSASKKIPKESSKKEIKKTVNSKTSKKDEKIALYKKDIKKHFSEVDDDFLEIIVKNLGPSIYRKDAELVSCSDSKELDTVRRNFLVKKLGMTQTKETLDLAIENVCKELKSVRKKYRATFYYRLAKNLKKESKLS